MTEEMTCAQRSLLRATQLLWAASQNDIDVDLATNLPEVLLQSAVRMLVWQAASLLPDGLALEGAQPAPTGLLAALEEAETHLRARPICEYPDGTTDLVINLCDAIARTRAGEWL